MNYIKQINAFYDHIERNPLSASAVTLWHALMHINNKAMWVESFTVAAPVLRLKSGLKDSSFKRARTELKEKGYIDYQSRDRNQAPVYWMVSLVLELGRGADWVVDQESGLGVGVSADRHMDREPDHVGQGMNQDVDHLMNRDMNDHADQRMDHHTDPLIKQKKDKKKLNETKQNDSDATTDAFVFYQENFGVISPFVSDDLLNWVNDMGDDLIVDAMKRALEQGKGNWGYVKGILQAWVKKGITSVEAAKAEEVEFRRGQRGRGYSYGAGTEEVVPDWFKERKRGERLKREQGGAEGWLRDPAFEQDDFEELLVEFRSGRQVG